MMTVLLQDCWPCLLIVQQSMKSWLNTERVITYFNKTTAFLLTLTKQNVLPQPEEADVDVNLCSRESRSALFTIHLHQPCCSVSREQRSRIDLPSKGIRQKQSGCTSALLGDRVVQCVLLQLLGIFFIFFFFGGGGI